MNLIAYPILQPVDVLEEADLKKIVNDYLLKSKPLVIRGVAKQWPAYQKWTGEEFIRQYGKTQVVGSRGKKREDKRYFLLAEYLNYAKTTQDNPPYYLADWRFSGNYPELLDDYTVPDYFENWVRRIPEELFQGEAADYGLRWMYIGAKNTSSPMHRDVLGTSAWNAVLSGKKEWLFYPAHETENLYGGSIDGFKVDLDVNPRYKSVEGYTCIQEAGDLVFTPSQWWHQVRNLEAGMSITENFINDSNIAQVAAEHALIEGNNDILDSVIQTYIPEINTAKLALEKSVSKA